MGSDLNRWKTNCYNTVTHRAVLGLGGNVIVVVFSHGGHIPAANAAAQRGVVAMAGSVTVATTAALTTEAIGGVPFAEGPPGFITANHQIGGGAALHTGEG